MVNYFEKTKKSTWSFTDAYRDFEEVYKELSTQQKLNRFYEFLKKQQDPLIESWLRNWNSFYNRIMNPKGPKTPQKKSSNVSQVKNDFTNSSNATVNIGSVNNYNKRETDVDSDIEEPAQKRRNRTMEEEKKEEEIEDDPRSDLSNDYHPNRTLEYILEESNEFENTINETAETNTPVMDVTYKDTWLVEEFDVIDALQKFKAASSKISPKKLSDMRLLATNSIYLFALENSESITNYMDVYDTNDLDGDRSKRILDIIKDDLDISEGAVTLNTNIINWANELAQGSIETKDWLDIQNITIPFLATAQKNKDKVELVAANILHRLALNFSNRQPDNKLEDSFVHNVISAVFDSIFQSDSVLSYQWADGFLSGSSRYKPDFVVFVKHSMDRYDIAVSEVKSPSNANCNNVGESDLVKIGKEMVWMLNALIREGVEEPVVCGVLLKGLNMTTFKMDLQYPEVYRLVELSSVKVLGSLQEVSMLPSILRNIIQVKNIAKKTAIKTKKRALSKSIGKTPVHSPPLSYVVNSTYSLRREQKKKMKQQK